MKSHVMTRLFSSAVYDIDNYEQLYGRDHDGDDEHTIGPDDTTIDIWILEGGETTDHDGRERVVTEYPKQQSDDLLRAIVFMKALHGSPYSLPWFGFNLRERYLYTPPIRQTLATLIRNPGNYSYDWWRNVRFALLHAVHFIHSNNIVHCNLQPNCIVVGDDGSVNLIGFDYATLIIGGNYIIQARTIDQYTLHYRAPELLQDTIQHGIEAVSNYDALKADVFALGRLWWDILTIHIQPLQNILNMAKDDKEQVFRLYSVTGTLPRQSTPFSTDWYYDHIRYRDLLRPHTSESDIRILYSMLSVNPLQRPELGAILATSRTIPNNFVHQPHNATHQPNHSDIYNYLRDCMIDDHNPTDLSTLKHAFDILTLYTTPLFYAWRLLIIRSLVEQLCRPRLLTTFIKILLIFYNLHDTIHGGTLQSLMYTFQHTELTYSITSSDKDVVLMLSGLHGELLHINICTIINYLDIHPDNHNHVRTIFFERPTTYTGDKAIAELLRNQPIPPKNTFTSTIIPLY